jgi:hypothetical protein
MKGVVGGRQEANMQSTSVKSKATQSGSNSQPLFRPEVIAARSNYHGEVLLLRPLSLTIISWTAIALVMSVVGFLFWGQYAPVRRVPVSLGAPPNRSPEAGRITANVSVPLPDGESLAPGSTLVLLCRSCATEGQSYRIKATVSEIIPAPNLGPAESRAGLRTETLVVRLSPNDFNSLFNPSTPPKVEAEFPLPRQPLYRWLFQPGTQADRS